MLKNAFSVMTDHAKRPDVYAQTVERVFGHLRTFLRPQEHVLLCFPGEGEYSVGALFEKAITRVQAVPVRWEADCRWQALLKLAFSTRATAIIGPPLIVLGLTKLARATGTPLNIRNVLLAGAPSEDWMIDGIQNGLDAALWGCYDPIPGLVVSGFSCGVSRGVHVAADAFDISVTAASGTCAEEGELGEIAVSLKDDPAVRFYTGEQGRLTHAKCGCGRNFPRLTDFRPGADADPVIVSLQERLLSWSSILDYRAVRTEAGLDLEVVCFPGVRLPVLPSCARRVVRHWNPKQDIPFCLG